MAILHSFAAMLIRELSLFHFRNYGEAGFSFEEGLNCFAGKNGSGKTNVLDAIHYLCLTRSFFHVQDVLNKQLGAEMMLVKGVFDKNGSEEVITCGINQNSRKVLKCNGKEYDRMADHIGRFPVVMIVPSQINLIYEGSEERRRLLDMAISQTNKQYLDDLMRYNKALEQRNRQLKQFGQGRDFDRELLHIWEKTLVDTAQRICLVRQQYVAETSAIFQEQYGIISNNAEHTEIIYQSELQNNSLADLLEQNLSKDLVLQRTTSGIHKDDLLFNINGNPLKKFGSQGQQKSFIVALKLAEYAYLAKHSGVQPLLLLDDIFEKIDSFRAVALLRMLDESKFGQVFITDTDMERLQKALEHNRVKKRFFLIDEGNVVILDK